jgi:hypothetical protein
MHCKRDFSICWNYRQAFADRGGSRMRHGKALRVAHASTACTEARREATMLKLEADAASLVHASI